MDLCSQLQAHNGFSHQQMKHIVQKLYELAKIPYAMQNHIKKNMVLTLNEFFQENGGQICASKLNDKLIEKQYQQSVSGAQKR